MGWKEALTGVDSREAFRLINIKGKDLSQKQKDALWDFWKQNKESSFDIKYWQEPMNWVVDKSGNKSIDRVV